MPRLTQPEGVRLYKQKAIVHNELRGSDITAGPTGFASGTWTPTFTQDFDDVNAAIRSISAVEAYTPNTFWAKGSYDVTGVASTRDKGYVPGLAPEGTLYYQRAASVLGLGIGNFSTDVGNSYSSIESMRQKPGTSYHDVEDGSTVISEGFSQCYGMFEAKMKLPSNFRSDCAIAWPGFWMYSNRWENPDKPPVEIDIFEIYQSSPDNVARGDGTYHSSMHTHDTIKSLLYPGYISRDYASSNIMGMNPNATFGAAADFDWGAAYHLFQCLITPEWMIHACDGIEVTRYPMLDAYHQKLYMLLSHQVNNVFTGTGAKAGITGFIEDVIVWCDNDWVKVWQNPDWNNRTIGGTTNAKTVTTGLAMASYIDGRIVNGTSTTANTITNPTLNANGLGDKVVKKYSDFANNPPWVGILVPLAIGDIAANGRHNYKFNVAGDCWILLNPANPFNDTPKCYVAPAYGVSQKIIDVPTIEGRLMQQWNKPQLLPDDHIGKTGLTFDTNLAQPRCAPNKAFVTITTAVPGTIIGTYPISGTPAVPARATISGSPNFDIDPATGVISVAEGAVLVEGVETPQVSWWSQGIPTRRGANVGKASITIRPDAPFNYAAYFGANLAMLYEFDTPANMTTDGVTPIVDGGKVATLLDSSGQGRNGSQVTDANRLTYNATGLNGHGCISSAANNGLFLNLTAPVFNSPLNAMDGMFFYNDTSAGIAPNNIARHTDPFASTALCSAFFSWDPTQVLCWINGTSMPVSQVFGTIPTSGCIMFFGQTDIPSSTLFAIYAANEISAKLFQTVSGSFGWKGKAGLLFATKSGMSQVDREKAIGEAHWRWGKTDLLPVGFPWKTVRPTLYG